MTLKIIIIPAAVVLIIGLFFVYITENGYSPFHAGLYIEEITQEEAKEFTSNIGAPKPIVLYTLDKLEEESTVLELFEKFSKQYPVAKNSNDEERRIKNYLPDEEASRLFEWIHKNNLSPFEYQDRYYQFMHWIA